MSLEKKIQKVTVPTIELDEMSMTNTDDKENPLYSTDRKTTQSGSVFPLAQINKYKFSENELSAFELDFTDIIPTVKLSIVSSDGLFVSKSYPKDGDPLSIFVRSKIEEFSPIRCDFEIDNISSFPSKGSEGDIAAYTISGTLRVPKLFSDFCTSYKNMTSYAALMTIATDLKLGFASNVLETDDKMTWLQAYDNYLKTIVDITTASYNGDDCFFNTWIDQYYIMNFIDVNSQFGEEFEIDLAIESLNMQKDHNEGQEIQKFDTKLLLTNHKNIRGQGNWISGYTLLNNCGEVVKANGYRRYVQFYDRTLEGDPKTKYQSYFVEPLTTEGVSDSILLRGRTKEPDIFNEQNKHKFVGMQCDGMHKNYMHALVNNWQNKQEIEKMILHVSLAKCNFNLYRGQRVPVLLLNMDGNKRQKLTQDPEISNETSTSVDKFLSGYYYIIGMRIMWDEESANFFQDIYLSRREWPIPHQTIDNLAQG